MMLEIGVGNNEIFPLSKGTWNICVDIRKPKNKLDNFILCSATNLPFKNDCFEFGRALDVIEHIDKPLMFLEEIRRTCKNVIVITPNSQYIGCIFTAILNKNNMYYTHYDHLFTFSKFELIQIFKRVGYRNPIVYFGDFNREKGKINIGKFIPFKTLKYRALCCIATC